MTSQSKKRERENQFTGFSMSCLSVNESYNGKVWPVQLLLSRASGAIHLSKRGKEKWAQEMKVPTTLLHSLLSLSLSSHHQHHQRHQVNRRNRETLRMSVCEPHSVSDTYESLSMVRSQSAMQLALRVGLRRGRRCSMSLRTYH